MTDVQRQIRTVRISRALFIAVAVAEAALFAQHLASGADVLAAMSGFAAVLFAASALLASLRLGNMKRAVARDAPSLPPGFVPPSAALGSVPRCVWDVSMSLSLGPSNGVVHSEDASRKPGGSATGVIRVIPCTAVLPWSLGEPVVTSWTAVTRASSHGEGLDLLLAAGPLLRDELFNHCRPGTRYFRLVNGVLAEVPDRLAALTVTPSLTAPAPAPAKAAVTQPDSGAVKLDPRWEWKLVQGPGMPDRYVKVRCLHTEVEPVESADGKRVVAQLCLTCDTQFPAPVED